LLCFNSRKRSGILGSLFEEKALAPIWRLCSWSYGSASSLLVINNGKVLSQFSSDEGVMQGDVLASLLFSVSMKKPYSQSIQDLECLAVADIYIVGPSPDVFIAFDRFSDRLPAAGLTLSGPKSQAFIPPSSDRKLIKSCSTRQLQYTQFRSCSWSHH